MGIIMQEKGQADKAKAVFQQVIKQYPTSAAAKQGEKSRRRLIVRNRAQKGRFDRFLGLFA
ncbi:tetratricopeptide repeat protein [Serratia ureilytica]